MRIAILLLALLFPASREAPPAQNPPRPPEGLPGVRLEEPEPAGFDPAERLLVAGRDALLQGDLGLATVHLQGALELAPGEPEIRLLLARTLNDRGKGDEAIAVLDPDPEPPSSAWTSVERARALQATGATERAEEALRAALASYPGCGSARLELVRLLADHGRLEEARAELDALVAAAPKEPAVIVLEARLLEAAGSPEQALARLQGALEEEIGTVPLRLALARLLIDADRAEEAWGAVEPLLDPWLDVDTSLQVVRVALVADRPVDALALLGAALVVDPTHPEVLHDLLELVEDRHELVARLAQRRIDADLEDTYGWGELLEEYLAAGRCQDVLDALQEAPPSVLADLEVRRHEATALRRLGRTEEARAKLEELGRGQEVEPELWYELGLLHYANSRHEDAASSFAKAATGDLEADARYNQALCLRRLERSAEAAAAFEAAVAARPAFKEAWVELGRECRFRLGDAERARRAFARYLELGGDDAEVRRWMESDR